MDGCGLFSLKVNLCTPANVVWSLSRYYYLPHSLKLFFHSCIVVSQGTLISLEVFLSSSRYTLTHAWWSLKVLLSPSRCSYLPQGIYFHSCMVVSQGTLIYPSRYSYPRCEVSEGFRLKILYAGYVEGLQR